jgi:cytochrome c peroxidase
VIRKIIVGFLFISIIVACVKEDTVVNLGKSVQSAEKIQLDLPAYFPPFKNHIASEFTKERVALGKKLFFDKRLSLDNSISCASCHVPEHSFSDPKTVSVGVGGGLGFRNAPALVNMPLNESFFRDGGVSSLELTVLVPFDSHVEFNLHINDACEKLARDKEYNELFQLAFGTIPSPYGLTRAISSFVKTLLHYNSKYDKYAFQANTSALSEEEKRGMELFFSNQLKCASCHSGFNFNNEGFENNGLKSNYDNDPGKQRVTLNAEDIGKFKVPTLRNIALTAPYMHDGSLVTLEEVIAHYESGGSNHQNKSNLIMGFSLTQAQKSDLLAFLNSLTDVGIMELE